MNKKLWSEEELIIAFNLYCKLPFGQYHKNNNKVIELARLLRRTPSSIALKLVNFARFDPQLKRRGIKGMQHGSKLENKIWNQFNSNWEELAYQSEIALAKLRGLQFPDITNDETNFPEGLDKLSVIKIRINQNFFRKMVLSSYGYRCAICSLPEIKLLVASHIIPWSINPSIRMDPRNGISLCALHDKAFDRGLITINNEYVIRLSNDIRKFASEPSIKRGFSAYENLRINLPNKFMPNQDYINYHMNNIFIH